MATPSDSLGLNEKLFPGRQFISTVLDLLARIARRAADPATGQIMAVPRFAGD